jgi:hypothetical protein
VTDRDEADYSKCWAQPLGNCAGGMSGEHPISRSQFGDGPITVQGYPWCKGETRTVGINSLVAKILCQQHNNATSPLDDSAADTLRALRAIAERGNEMRAGSGRKPRRIFRVSGDNLERWLLKTTINLALQSRLTPTGGIFDRTGRPAGGYVDIVFGRAAFAADEGLTWVAQVGENIPFAEQGTIRFEPWYRREDNALVAAFLSFHGFRLWLATVDAPKIEHGVHPIRIFDAADVDMRIEFAWSKARNRQFTRNVER